MRKILENINKHLSAFIKSYNRLEKRQHKMEKYPELSITEVHFLVFIAKEKPKNLSEIARKKKISRSAVTQMVNKLSEKGFLMKETKNKTSNTHSLYLTNTGCDVVQQHDLQQSYLEKEIYSILASYSAEFLNEVLELMKTIENVWESTNNHDYWKGDEEVSEENDQNKFEERKSIS